MLLEAPGTHGGACVRMCRRVRCHSLRLKQRIGVSGQSVASFSMTGSSWHETPRMMYLWADVAVWSDGQMAWREVEHVGTQALTCPSLLHHVHGPSAGRQCR